MPHRLDSSGDVLRIPAGPRFTGRHLVVYRSAGDAGGAPKAMRDRAGLTMAVSSDFTSGAVDPTQLGGADGVYFERLGLAIISATPKQLAPLTAAPGAGGVAAVEPEHYVYLFGDPRASANAPLREPASASGVAAQGTAVGHVCSMTATGLANADWASDETDATWGLTCTRVPDSRFTGRGVRVAVLDSGFDATHPDFAGRNVVRRCFLQGHPPDDGHGHGTHCAGTALGILRPEASPRYGIASEADVFIAKVMRDDGIGLEGDALAGIEWAIANRCRIVSLSLGFPEEGRHVWETAGQRALTANTLLVAAAGNESRRPDQISPVECPANCPSIMAVGAIDSDMQIAGFSTRGMRADGGAIDIVAPGVDVYSSVPMPMRYDRKFGTSMACPHVAGIAALYAEANPRATAREIWQMLVTNAKKLDLDVADAGAGLVQAP